MLKRLELIGFKSFADRTEFTFGPGVTAIVGPNGSGKSNVVDAVRWILGEQSAKSLRGGEMTDVIFNGSSTRRALGMAEVSLVFDNTQRRLDYDGDEVQITRRVYRDGQGEYLINRQPARLKDIKELMLGTGAGTDAYSIIAQGRVEALLQSSTQDRRQIFEEAAGISRFRTRKLETLRKLEAMEHNLARSRDLVTELQRQLQTVKLQAAKAEKYREYHDQLLAHRTSLALNEYHQLTLAWEAATARWTQARAELARHAAQETDLERQLRALEEEVAHRGEAIAAAEARLGELRAEMAAHERTLHYEDTNLAQGQREIAELEPRQAELLSSLADLEKDLALAQAELTALQAETLERETDIDATRNQVATAREQLDHLRQQYERAKQQLVEGLHDQTTWHNELVSVRAQAQSLAQHQQRLSQKHNQANQHLTQLDIECQRLEAGAAAIQAELEAARADAAALEVRQSELQTAMAERGAALSALRERRGALASRMDVLTALETSREGVGTAVRAVLDAAQADPAAWGGVVGLVADLLNVSHAYAALLDLALGDLAQAIVVRDARLLSAYLERETWSPQGRVTFMPMQPGNVLTSEMPNRLRDSVLGGRGRIPAPATVPAHEGIVAFARTLVAWSEPILAAWTEPLFGDLVIVRDLSTAREIHRQYPGLRSITLAGELLTAEGLLTVGTQRIELGMISRKSELRQLHDEIQRLDGDIAAADAAQARDATVAEDLVRRDRHLADRLRQLNEQVAAGRLQLEQLRERSADLAQEVQIGSREMRQLEDELRDLRQRQAAAEAEESATRERIQHTEAAIQALEHQIKAAEAARHQAEQRSTAAQVAAATAKERQSAAEGRAVAMARLLEERSRDLANLRSRRADLEQRLAVSSANHAAATEKLRLTQGSRDAEEARLSELSTALAEVRQRHRTLLEHGSLQRQAWQQWQTQVHQDELAVAGLAQQRDALVERVKEECEIDLAARYQESPPTEEVQDVSGLHAVVQDLKRKLAKLGNVNLDSLQELAELQTRADDVQRQHEDLLQAKGALEEIIAKINADSRVLFATTFNSVRGHFQELFRKLFGGGMADLILENPEDVLESGIEIQVRPPGKEMRNLSLLSGGEKALTAVALLLAIFRDKPSPFCILDEVDAPLDEANVGRFALVLRDFLHLSQFIIITHSKKTMSAADVLYGITMQEAGVSKRVAVRLDDATQAAAARAA